MVFWDNPRLNRLGLPSVVLPRGTKEGREMGGLSSVASGEGGFHGQNQNKNQNTGKGEWKGLALRFYGGGVLRPNGGWNGPGTGFCDNGQPSGMLTVAK